MAQRVVVEGPDKFDAVVAETVGKLENEHDTFYVYFFSDWCPDCHKADPLVYEELAKQKTGKVLTCNVGLRDTYKTPSHPYRLHNQIKLTAIPTLFIWGKDGPKERLVEADCYDQQQLTHFVAGKH